jgi:hypothetical protein
LKVSIEEEDVVGGVISGLFSVFFESRGRMNLRKFKFGGCW